ncbi:hypothetical protein LPJ78_004590 [Coemansia sp. RSA 989]|nr:Cilia/flagella-associated protein 20/WDR90/C3orf67 [Coemansia mojavensis]KAJ1740068.1 hypothetical protein LPJ68_004112 [Coemansia sp. RSA 1086]KAJ1748511.1 hypothetical protein LPJ79_004467 [Coemansia sp. RSA 1821]KAJ1862640.1 hypothetical protein LPJ78_004590 [Coemansia sp. RSA 989]KAJ1870508.1 hypothetical protein LPJ55_004613 [Coemansia sp. RSA 990]KAJ2627544.1 hypothetical protein H4R22_004348 [Coemansia sp. RSA 1290]KAJ2653596.1 hypothetical protein IWW40_000290 [Coemansia sp. RSA 12
MFGHAYQSGIITLFNSVGSDPLQLWSSVSANGISITTDDEVEDAVLCLQSTDLAQTFISCPKSTSDTLGITLPYLTILVKNTGHLFSLEVEYLDSCKTVRRIRTSNYQRETVVKHQISCLPLKLDQGWNYLTLDFSDMASRLYGTGFKQVQRITIHANVCLRLVMFADRIVAEDELPQELRLYAKKPE